MPEFLKKFLDSMKNLLTKTTLVQKLMIGGAFLFVVVAFIILMALNTSSVGIPLFTDNIDINEIGRITKKLQEDKIPFTIKNGSIIFLRNEKEKNEAIMTLAQNGLMPKGHYTLQDIINTKKITTSRSLENVKFRAALQGQLAELLEASNLVYSAKVNITMPPERVYLSEREPPKVAVVITPKYGVRFEENKASIKGIEGLIVNSIDGAKKENVVITDNFGVVLNDFSSEETDITILQIEKNLKIREKQIEQYKQKLEDGISQIIPKDRFSLLVDVQMNFNKEKEERTEVLPVILKASTPGLPYDDGERRYSIPLSGKKTNETFEGPNWIPEGPPGFDSNVPPGYKGALEQMTKFIRNEEIYNEQAGESKREIIKNPWEFTKITAAVMVDGTYEIQYDEKGKVKTYPDKVRRMREYKEASPEEIKSLKAFVEQGIGFGVGRIGDKVEVSTFKKDRSNEFYLADVKWKRDQQVVLVLLYGILGLVIIVIIGIAWRLIQKEIQRQKILREQELARQHAIAREMALKSAEEEGLETEMSMEEKARLELQATATQIAKEHPEDVAALIRTWLSDE